MAGCLAGLKVVDLTRMLAGPYITLLLGDLGADIIKIENTDKGDDTRLFTPLVNGFSAYFASVNRNKRSLTLNLKKDAGKKILFELLKDADVLVENFRPGVMKKLGLEYSVIKEINPSIIYASCSGFGQTGPWREKPAYDTVVQGLGGVMSITGTSKDSPVRVGTSIGDISAGMYTAIGILAALYERNTSGEGQAIDVSMLDGQIAILENAIARYYATGKTPEPIGNKHPSTAPFDTFKAKDGHVIIAVANERNWQALCKLIGREDLISDSKFCSNPMRVKNSIELKEIIDSITSKKTIDEWVQILGEKLPCSPINTIERAVNNEQVISRDMIVETNVPTVGTFKIVGTPIKFSKNPGGVRFPAPLHGQHTTEILEALGYSEDQLKELKEQGVIS